MTITKELIFPVKTITGDSTGDNISLNLNVPSYFQSKTTPDKTKYIIHRAFITQRNNERQGSVKTKTRAEVRGGGKKPWRQKGTGRARAGSNRSPLWNGGGVTFGPRPKNYSTKINRKEWRLSLRLLLASKETDIVMINNLEIESSKTKTISTFIKNLGFLEENRIVIITDKRNENLLRATKNIKNIVVLNAKNLNIKQILLADKICIVKESVKMIEEIYNV
ncbi:unnamed protein product [Chrysoparadoxa australica]